MIRTEIDITNPQKVEVIETGEIGYVTCFDNKDGTFFITDREGKGLGWCKPKQLRPIEDEKLVFDVEYVLDERLSQNGLIYCRVRHDTITDDFDLEDYNYQVIATPKEKSLEDEVKEILVSENGFTKDYLLNNRGLIGATIDIVKQLKK